MLCFADQAPRECHRVMCVAMGPVGKAEVAEPRLELGLEQTQACRLGNLISYACDLQHALAAIGFFDADGTQRTATVMAGREVIGKMIQLALNAGAEL